MISLLNVVRAPAWAPWRLAVVTGEYGHWFAPAAISLAVLVWFLRDQGAAWCGAGVGLSDFVSVSMGAGVGGAIVSGGRLLEGRLGNAGHIGHIVVEPDGRPCACGGKGCLEAYCSGRAIEEETGRPPQRAPQAIVERTGIFVGRALASLGAVCDLRTAIIGGSVALGFGEPFFAAVQSELDHRARLTFTQGFKVMPAGLGQLAPLVGAAALARGI